ECYVAVVFIDGPINYGETMCVVIAHLLIGNVVQPFHSITEFEFVSAFLEFISIRFRISRTSKTNAYRILGQTQGFEDQGLPFGNAESTGKEEVIVRICGIETFCVWRWMIERR